jgi:type IV secretory pathway VirD2 relaxase
MAANVKMLKYISHNGTEKPIHSAKEHIKYMEANREKHRNKPDLFNDKADKLDRREFFKRIQEQPKNGVVLHKMVITLSEDERNRLQIDLRELARDTMAAFETQIGRRLDWVAAIHDDEGHPHVHIAFRGRDQDGKQVGIYPIHVKQLKEIADKEKIRQAERNLSRSQVRDIIKELDKERESSRYIQYEKSYSDRSVSNRNDFSKDMLNIVEQMIKQSQREIERAQRRAEYEAEREAKRKRNRGRGMER